MTTAIQVFNNPKFGDVRVIEINGEPWFVGNDVCQVLGYGNPRDALKKHVDDEDRGVANCDTLGGMQAMTVINESGLYSLILRSNLPEAREFKHWITADVIPSLRKHGVYATDKFLEMSLADPAWAIGVLQAFKAERDKNIILQTQIAEMTPKVTYYDVVLACKDLVSVSKIAKDYGMSGIAFNRLLHELKVQFKQGNIWLLYQKYAVLGWTSTKTQTFKGSDGTIHSKVHTYWTQKGRLGLYELLKQHGYLPLIEREVA